MTLGFAVILDKEVKFITMYFLFRLLMKKKWRGFFLIHMFFFKPAYGSFFNDVAHLEKTIGFEKYSLTRACHKQCLDYKWNLENTLYAVISSLAESLAVPKDVKDIIIRYSITWENEVSKKGCFRRFYTDKYRYNPPRQEYIDAYGIDVVYYGFIDAALLTIFLKHVRKCTIIIDRCHILSLIIQLGSIRKLIIKNSHIGKLELGDDVTLFGPLSFEKSTFHKMLLYPKNNKGFTIEDRKVKFNSCKVHDSFFFDTLSNNKLHYNDYVFIGIDALFAPRCKVHIGDNVRALNFGSRFFNSPMLEQNLKPNNVNCCCYGCSSCMYNYCRLNGETFAKIACKDFDYPICNCNCCLSEEAKGDMNFCFAAFIGCVTCSVGCLAYPLLALPKMCKDYVNFLSDTC